MKKKLLTLFIALAALVVAQDMYPRWYGRRGVGYHRGLGYRGGLGYRRGFVGYRGGWGYRPWRWSYGRPWWWYRRYYGPTFAVNLGVPTYRVRYVESTQSWRDNRGMDYWEIFNDTQENLVVTNGEGKDITIAQGESADLGHVKDFSITFEGAGQTRSFNIKNHYITVTQDEGGKLKIDSN